MGDGNYLKSPGKIRPTQVITTYGVGSIMQTEHDSVMVMGIDFWKNDGVYKRVNHMYLEKITRRSHFKMPYVDDEGKFTVACTSYPRWGYCTKCRRLQRHGKVPKGEYFTCETHTDIALLPARLITVCRRGHVGEFPWLEWTHSRKGDPRPVCKSPKLRWSRGESSSISDFSVECDSCGAYNSMRGALSFGGIKLHNGTSEYTYPCTGNMPWLDKQEDCTKIGSGQPGSSDTGTEVPRGMLVRSTSLHYPRVIRGIVIPHLANPVAKFVQSEGYKPYRTSPKLKSMSMEEKIDDILGSEWEGSDRINVDLMRKYPKKKIMELMDKMDSLAKVEVETEDQLKEIEYDDLLNNDSGTEDDGGEIKISDINLESGNEYFVIKRLDILTAIEVSRYFTRLEPPGEVNIGDGGSAKETICSLEANWNTSSGKGNRPGGWLPCVIKKGEGIFVVFNREFIQSCLRHPGLQKRLDSLIRNHRRLQKESERPEGKTDRQYILIHSISHALIKELVLESGYSEASISERIYSSEKMCGILIYTTNSGEGSLGGLARQANPEFTRVFKNALRGLESCSRDPLCINHDPAQTGVPSHMSRNGSACYACLILPETSCENFNMMLDRRILVDGDFGVIKDVK